MTRRRFATSIRQLTLAGFALVVLPLVAALIITYIQTDRLASDMLSMVRQSAQAVETGRIIVSQTISLDRTASQFLVLRDPALLERYQSQRKQLDEAISLLLTLPIGGGLRAQLTDLRKVEHRLNEKLLDEQPIAEENAQKPKELQNMSELANPVPSAIAHMITEKSEAMNARIEKLERILLLQAILLAPLALLLAAVFGVLITRPLRQLVRAIRKLGSGEFSSPVTVSGPQDIRELGQRLNWLRQRLAELDEQKLIFLQHVSHELKTPLTAIREGAGLMNEEIIGPLNPQQKEVAQILQDNSLQLQSQVEDLLNFNQALTQEAPIRSESVPLHELIAEVVNKHQLSLQSRQLNLRQEVQPSFVSGDSDLLRTIIDNLLSNAIKYSPEGGVIEIRLHAQSDQVVLEVADSGPGVPNDEREQIFKPFYQGQTRASGHIKGTGLGLAIVKRYVDMHNGKLDLLKQQKGAVFRVSFPALAIVGVNS